MIRVEFGRLGGSLTAYAPEAGTTARQLVDAEGIDTSGQTIQVNGAIGAENDALEDGDVVLLTQAVKGGQV